MTAKPVRLQLSRKRDRARDLLQALEEGEEFERRIRDGEIIGLQVLDEKAMKSIPHCIGIRTYDYEQNCLMWYAAPMVVNAVKGALRSRRT